MRRRRAIPLYWSIASALAASAAATTDGWFGPQQAGRTVPCTFLRRFALVAQAVVGGRKRFAFPLDCHLRIVVPLEVHAGIANCRSPVAPRRLPPLDSAVSFISLIVRPFRADGSVDRDIPSSSRTWPSRFRENPS